MRKQEQVAYMQAIADTAYTLGASSVCFVSGAVAIMTGFVPNTARLSAYYLASHKSHGIALALQQQFTLTQQKELRIKPFLHQHKIALQGHNTLCAAHPMGSYFAAQVLFDPKLAEVQATPTQGIACTNCGACSKACPVQAITQDGFCKEKCLRFHMDNRPMPQAYMRKSHSLLGCELCQRVCPRNAGIAAKPLEKEIAALFTLQSILRNDVQEQKARASLVGKNMLSSKRLQVQALILAANQNEFAFADVAKQMLAGNDCEIVAADYYLSCNTKARKD